jgi:predicted phage terminase large subunit-like protein
MPLLVERERADDLALEAIFRIKARQQRAAAHQWHPMPHQVPPEGNWRLWMLLGGRGSGKTDALAYYVDQHVKQPPCDPRLRGGHRVGIVAPTLGDAENACINGPSGLKAHNPAVRMVQRPGGAHVYWPGNAEALLFSTDDARSVDRLRAGGNRCLDWWEEFAAWPLLEDAYDNAVFGLRIGEHPHAVASTTPKNRKKLRDLIADPDTALRRATTDDNPHLSENFRKWVYSKFGGTERGRQELGGELIEDVAGALWKRARLDKHRTKEHPDLARAVVAVDPSGGHAERNDEQGIVVAGRGVDGRGYVLADRSCKLSPDGWGRRAVQAYLDYDADRVIYEKNFGGEMVEAVIRTAASAMGVTVPTKAVHASRGKAVRAEPVSALDEQGRISHVGAFPDLEDELCTWTPDSGESPNRLDALVWALTELMIEHHGWGAV